MDELGITGSWLTVNRYCNFRCQWCYAQDTEYKPSDDMDRSLAFNLIDLVGSVGVKKILFIGGEPTFWRYLGEAAGYVKALGMKPVLVTNGYLLGQPRYFDKFRRMPFDAVGVSVKAGNNLQHDNLTQTKGKFESVLDGITAARTLDIEVTASVVVSSLVADNLVEIVSQIAERDPQMISIQFCTPVWVNDQAQRGYMIEPAQGIRLIADNYDQLLELTGGRMLVESMFPLCAWPPELLQEMMASGTITFGCHVRTRSGLIFDTDGSVLPCNGLTHLQLGKYGEDFEDAEGFADFWQTTQVFSDQLVTYPTKTCINCGAYDYCGGGCSLHWFILDPDKHIPTKGGDGHVNAVKKGLECSQRAQGD